ncbi:antibiotic biosynthesis monooxygenase family protein [Streptosporangium sp. NPDC001559]|uniref:antibiotic biosynthesis monooxygenase family protein n=1 Tax=Streptosporangium sp. NPDC001559 TaxID=3366187 RepID=UPI0036EC03AA
MPTASAEPGDGTVPGTAPAVSPQPDENFVTFDVFRTDGVATAGILAETITRELSSLVGEAPGFVSARVHTDLGGTTVVVRGEWADARAHRGFVLGHPAGRTLRELANRPGVLSVTAFGGVPEAGLRGPAAGRVPGIVAVATRYLADRESAEALLRLLADSGEWKRHFPGFISATPYLAPDAKTFVNYPMWVDEAAYRAWMDDPRITTGQEEITRLEVAPAEYLVCRVVADIHMT